MVFSWWAVPGIIGGSLSWFGAWLIWKKMPDALNRYLLTALLFAEGMLVWSSYSGPAALIENPPFESVYPFLLLHAINDFLVVGIYLPTIARLIDTPMLRPFRDTPIKYFPPVVAFIGILLLLFGPLEWHIANVLELPSEYPNPIQQPGPVWAAAFILLALTYTYGLIATLLAWRSSSSELQKRKNGLLALAFGVRDFTFIVTFALGTFAAVTLTEPIQANIAISYFYGYAGTALIALGLVFYVFLTAYGVLSIHIFDIDLQIKWTLSRGTVTAMFVAFFFLISELSAEFLSDQFGIVIGVVATASLLFFIAPMQRWAEQFSDAAMPSVRESEEYLSFRKLQTYGEAVTSSLREQKSISAVDRVLLNQLQEKLGLAPEESKVLEAQILSQIA